LRVAVSDRVIKILKSTAQTTVCNQNKDRASDNQDSDLANLRHQQNYNFLATMRQMNRSIIHQVCLFRIWHIM